MKNLLAAIVLAGLVFGAKAQPVVTSAPSSQTINAGSSAYFTVVAADASTNAVSYQWSNALGQISGATNATYAIENTSTNQAGVYGVAVSSTGVTTNLSATLTVLQGTVVNFQISGFAAGPSNVVVELFDHDKPATVQNFLHYIRSGVYSNLFIDRLLPGFVLQSGDYDAADRTNGAPGSFAGAINIYNTYVQPALLVPPLPLQIASEYNSGPVVSNTAGTLAVALPQGNVNGGNSAFFFNLVDNPGLDTPFTGGPFPVFGRVIAGSAVLDYFNSTSNFSKPSLPAGLVFSNNIFTNGIFDLVYLNTNSSALTDLPVNFDGTNIPSNTNLFFVDFSFPDANAQPVIDTNPPVAAITFPAANLLFTNGFDLVGQGTAADNVGLARVYASLYPKNGGYGSIPLNGDAQGTTPWYFDFGPLEPGIYNFVATAQDGAGNLSQNAEIDGIIVTAVLTNGVGTVTLTNVSSGGPLTPNAIGAYMATGTEYGLVAHAGPNQLFVNWSAAGASSISSNVTFTMESNMVLTATFISNAIPNSIAFTSPSLNGSVTNGNFMIQGTISGAATPPVTLTCQVFNANRFAINSPFQTTGTNTWSLAETNNLAPGQYVLQVVAQDAMSNSTLIINPISVLTGLALTTNGPGTMILSKTPAGDIQPIGNYLVAGQEYTLTAKPAKGAVFYSWSDGTTTTLNPVKTFIMNQGMALTATFISNNVSTALKVTSPGVNALLTNGNNFQLAGTIGKTVTATQIMCQLFLNSNSITAPMAAVITPGAWQLATQTNLAPGRSYTALVSASDAQGRTTLTSQNFSVLARLTLATNGLVASSRALGKITPVENGKFFQVGAAVPTLTATPNPGYLFAYWTINGATNYADPLSMALATNEIVTANFTSNLYLNTSGVYDGIFYPSTGAVTATNSGYFTMALRSTGLATLQFIFPHHAFTAIGYLPYYGSAGGNTANVDGYYLGFNINIDLTNGTDTVTGYVGNYDTGWVDLITAHRVTSNLTSNSSVLPGNYVLGLPDDPSAIATQPGGSGYATYSISANGAVALAGYLADGTVISQSTGVSKEGIWPFYVPLYHNATGYQGVILGWQTNYNPQIVAVPANPIDPGQSAAGPTNAGQMVAWYKPAKIGPYYTNGFNLATNTTPLAYAAPVAQTSYQIVFGGGTLTNPMTNLLTTSAARLFVPEGITNTVGATNRLVITLGKTGVITGQFVNPASKKTITFKGAFTSPDQGGAGYFLDTDGQSGWFQIIPPP